MQTSKSGLGTQVVAQEMVTPRQDNPDLKTLITLVMALSVDVKTLSVDVKTLRADHNDRFDGLEKMVDQLEKRVYQLAGQNQDQDRLFRSAMHSQSFTSMMSGRRIPHHYPNLTPSDARFLELDRDYIPAPIY